MTFRIDLAKPDDIEEIMRIETISFIQKIQEDRTVFLDRLASCPQGFLVLLPDNSADSSVAVTSSKEGPRPIAGYLCSEIWQTIPLATSGAWSLGHSAKARHSSNGRVLYISSFAVEQSARGGTGRQFFTDSLRSIRMSFPLLERVVLIVNENWLAARHIYETEGFVYTGKIESFFASIPATDALVMEKEL